MTRTLTPPESAELWRTFCASRAGDCSWPRSFDDLRRFANLTLAVYGDSTNERAILERERKAFEIGWNRRDSYNAWSKSFALRAEECDAAYSLPSPEPTPQPVEERVAYLEQRLAQLLDAHGENF